MNYSPPIKLALMSACKGDTELYRSIVTVLVRHITVDGNPNVEAIDQCIRDLERIAPKKLFSASCKNHDTLPITLAAH